MSRRIPQTKAVVTMPVPVGAMLAGVARSTGYSAAADGTFPAVEVGGRWLLLSEPFCRMFNIALDDPRVAMAYQLCGYEPPPVQGRRKATKTRGKPVRGAPPKSKRRAQAKS